FPCVRAAERPCRRIAGRPTNPHLAACWNRPGGRSLPGPVCDRQMISKQPKRIIHMKKTTGTMLLLAGICAALCYTSCKSAAGEPHEEEINYVATTPVQVDTLVTRDYVAQIHAIRHIELRA